jgi:phage baseplate assembly protein W
MTLSDISHWFGGDLQTTNSGDLLTVTGTVRGEQRVLRRLLTNPGDYVFEPDYGAGLPSYIGKTLDIGKLQALCLSQMLLEDAVAKNSAVVKITQSSTDFTSIQVQINYNDQPSNKPVVLEFSVSP